jgi:hypothetical protein
MKPEAYNFKVNPVGARRTWRKIEIRGDQTLHDLSKAIFKAFDFEEWHLYSFFMSGRAWDASTEYAGPNSGRNIGFKKPRSAKSAEIESFGLEPKTRFLYLFDYGDEWRFEVQFTGKTASEDNARYPRITDRKGESPPQYPEEEMENSEDEL